VGAPLIEKQALTVNNHLRIFANISLKGLLLYKKELDND
jgi:hypothetical protein